VTKQSVHALVARMMQLSQSMMMLFMSSW